MLFYRSVYFALTNAMKYHRWRMQLLRATAHGTNQIQQDPSQLHGSNLPLTGWRWICSLDTPSLKLLCFSQNSQKRRWPAAKPRSVREPVLIISLAKPTPEGWLTQADWLYNDFIQNWSFVAAYCENGENESVKETILAWWRTDGFVTLQAVPRNRSD